MLFFFVVFYLVSDLMHMFVCIDFGFLKIHNRFYWLIQVLEQKVKIKSIPGVSPLVQMMFSFGKV
jgi:hypothetical protein